MAYNYTDITIIRNASRKNWGEVLDSDLLPFEEARRHGFRLITETVTLTLSPTGTTATPSGITSSSWPTSIPTAKEKPEEYVHDGVCEACVLFIDLALIAMTIWTGVRLHSCQRMTGFVKPAIVAETVREVMSDEGGALDFVSDIADGDAFTHELMDENSDFDDDAR